MMGKNVHGFRNWRIKSKLSLLISVIMAVSFAIVFIVQNYAFNSYDEQIYETSSQMLNLSSAGIENELKRIEQVGFTVISDNPVQDSLRGLKLETSDYGKRVRRTEIQDRLIRIAGSEKYVYSMQILDTFGEEAVAGDTVNLSPQFKSEVNRLAVESSGETRWISPGKSDSSLMAVREIKAFRDTNFTLDHLGVLIIRVNLDKIVHDLSGASLANNHELLIANGSEVIYNSKPEFLNEMTQDGPFSDNGYRKMRFAGKLYFAASLKSFNLGWTYIQVIPYERLFHQIAWLRSLVFVVFVTVCLLGILGGLGFARTITRPIERLIAAMRTIDKDDFDKIDTAALNLPSPHPMDEVWMLQRTFRLMLQRIHELIKENYGKQLVIRETELKALQAQINPHFLYNTLESINWMAKASGQLRISKMVESLGHLLRNSISMERSLVTLGDELQLVNHYMAIQALRFEERLDYRLEVEAEALDCQVPSLSIQPLAENAIHYALEQKIGPCRIIIRSEVQNDAWIISVADDGPGIDPDTLAKLRRGDSVGQGMGIGIRNIDERLKLTFGEEYGVSYGNASWTGFVVQLRIPKKKDGRVKPHV